MVKVSRLVVGESFLEKNGFLVRWVLPAGPPFSSEHAQRTVLEGTTYVKDLQAHCLAARLQLYHFLLKIDRKDKEDDDEHMHTITMSSAVLVQRSHLDKLSITDRTIVGGPAQLWVFSDIDRGMTSQQLDQLRLRRVEDLGTQARSQGSTTLSYHKIYKLSRNSGVDR
eukprot:scaffold17955_cov147-Skeletonema_dohrnii-CCMP3373.AAC.1